MYILQLLQTGQFAQMLMSDLYTSISFLVWIGCFWFSKKRLEPIDLMRSYVLFSLKIAHNFFK